MKNSVLILFLIIQGSYLMASDDCARCHTDNPKLSSYKTMDKSDIAVGILDKGQLADYSGNMGDLANYHLWYQNSGHWPRSAPSDRQYAFGLGLIVGINKNNVIETVSQAQTKVTDWLPRDGANGKDYSGEITSVSDETPFQASSDFYETWPYGYYNESNDWINSENRVWPGFYRVDVGSLTPQQLNAHPDPSTLPISENEFVSDRDVFCVYNDDYNSRTSAGIEVEQTAHSYGRPYAEDFIFWDLKIHNTNSNDLDSIYIGMYGVFRPDYDNHDYINFIDSDNDSKKDLIYVYDLNNEPNKTRAESDLPIGITSIRIYDTPFQMGVTDFHHFARGVSPTNDEEFWAILTSDTSDTNLANPENYFHGDNIRLDNTEMENLDLYYPHWEDDESGVSGPGDAINFIMSCGPFDLPADTFVTFTLGMIMGDAGTIPDNPDTTDLMFNVRGAMDMYDLYFQGSGPPDPPSLIAIGEDESATLYWSSDPSEKSIDVLSLKRDFEGYKIFRSVDLGRTWGDVVTNAKGQPIGYNPIATFDLVNEVDGLDPAYPQYLGTNSGLVHTFKDSNLINGIEYWYCVTAYDKGNQNPDSLEQSYMYSLGTSILEPHTVAVIPGVTSTNLQIATGPNEYLNPIGGLCDGIVKVNIANSDSIKDHGYKITITDNAIYTNTSGDTTFGLGFTLVDTTENDTLFFNHTLSDETGDNIPVVDGFRIIIQEPEPAIKFAGWTKVLIDTCSFDWRFQSIDPGAGLSLVQEDINTFDDWRITVNYSDQQEIQWVDIFSGAIQETNPTIPIKIELISHPQTKINVTSESWLGEFAIAAPWEDYRIDYYSQIGWDLEPGGLGYLGGSPGWYEKHVDILILESDYFDTLNQDTVDNYLYLFTNNKPNASWMYFPDEDTNKIVTIDAKAPSEGDEFTIITKKNFSPDISYTFGFTPQHRLNVETNTLKDIRVVPDPYVVTNIWETSEFGKKLQFNHLPDQCTINIYTLVGDHIATVNHNDPKGYAFWDMRTKNDQFIAPGVYIYHAQTPNGDEAAGRFLVIK